MTTAVVVTSIVTTHVGEAGFVDHVLEQIRRNDRDLLNKLSTIDGDARVVTAILNVGEFMSYAQEYLREHEDAALWEEIPTEALPAQATSETGEINASKTVVVNAEMGELEFMAYTLAQLRDDAGPRQMSDEALTAMAEEHIGEDFSCQPFLY